MMGIFVPLVDVSETDTGITITTELPGIVGKDIQVSVGKHVVSISGKKEFDKANKSHNYFHVERSWGSFHREIPLHVEVDEGKIEAHFDKGVLTITAPRLPSVATKPKRIQVNKA